MPNLIEQASAKVAGKLGGVQASLSGLKGVFRKLAEEHMEVAVLLKLATETHDAEKRADLWTKLRAELVSHERAEINHVYPEFLPPTDGADLGEAHEAEADELEALVAELDALAFDVDEWQPAVERLQQAVLRHAAREEEHYFPRLQEAIGETRTIELEELYLRAKLAIVHDFD